MLTVTPDVNTSCARSETQMQTFIASTPPPCGGRGGEQKPRHIIRPRQCWQCWLTEGWYWNYFLLPVPCTDSLNSIVEAESDQPLETNPHIISQSTYYQPVHKLLLSHKCMVVEELLFVFLSTTRKGSEIQGH